MATFYSIFILFSVAFSTAAALECFVYDKTLNYAGFVHNSEWQVCMFTPTHHLKDFVAGGLSDENDHVDFYLGQFKKQYVHEMYTEVDYLCFNEMVHLPKVSPVASPRCVCITNRCNVREAMPDWLRHKTPHFPVHLNESISYRQLQSMRYYEEDN